MKYEVRDELYMMRCLQLAAMAEGQTSPNPMVGAVIVYDGKIIGEGYHHRAGEPHAEPNAIASVRDEALLKEATMYVSLEPCSHWGKTPPCADLIVRKGLKRVVIATLDPNPKVAGRGVKILQDAGIEVTVGVMEKEARWLNRRFMTVQEKRRPYVILKWAETADGIIDVCRKEKGSGPIKISNSVTKTLNHQVRVEEDAIMVATKTALLDDPHLTVTKWTGKNPVRVLLDRTLRVPADYRIFDGAAKTIVFTNAQCTTRGLEPWRKMHSSQF
jgi:diaminohydroxyphosphoribosylaminopyrimidine deaminase/5-amino-6-(5-phosphoribosylamino)uracil reductase